MDLPGDYLPADATFEGMKVQPSKEETGCS